MYTSETPFVKHLSILPGGIRASAADGPSRHVERVDLGLMDRAEPVAEVLEDRRDAIRSDRFVPRIRILLTAAAAPHGDSVQ